MRLGAVLVSTLVGVGLAERLLSGPLGPELFTGLDRHERAMHGVLWASLYGADDELIYVPFPNRHLEMSYGLAAHNGQAMRSEVEVSMDPGPDLRVAVLGDSIVWGDLLPLEHALPQVLDREMGDGFEVLNYGASGYDTVQEAAWYRRQVRPMQPDIAVLVFCLNDLLTMSGPLLHYVGPQGMDAYDAERAWLDRVASVRNESLWPLREAERRGQGSQVWAALSHTWRWHSLFTWPGGYIDEYLISARDPGRRARFSGALAQLGADLERDGVPGVLAISPGLYWWHRYQWDEVHQMVRQAGEAAGFTVVDPMDQWRGQDPSSLRWEGDNLHYTPEGNRRLAEIIAPAVLAEAQGIEGRRPAPTP